MFSEKINQISFSVTDRCNSKCQHCNVWKIKRFDGEFEKSEFEKLVTKSALPNCRLICLCGGESFLREDLPDLFEAVNAKYPKMYLSTATNGYCTDLIVSKCQKIKDAVGDVFSICISVDGLGKTHDAIRGVPKGFEKALKTVSEVRKIGINVFFNVTLMHLNVKELPDIIKLSEKRSDGLWLGVYGTGQSFNQEEKTLENVALTQDDKNLVVAQLKNKDDMLLQGLYEFLMNKHVKCTAGAQSLVVSPTLEVFPCSNCANSWLMGNLRDFDYDIESLLKSTQARRVVSLVKRCPEPCFNLVATPSSLASSLRFMLGYKIRTKGLKWIIKRSPLWLFRRLDVSR